MFEPVTFAARFLLAFPEAQFALLRLTVERLMGQSNTPRSVRAV